MTWKDKDPAKVQVKVTPAPSTTQQLLQQALIMAAVVLPVPRPTNRRLSRLLIFQTIVQLTRRRRSSTPTTRRRQPSTTIPHPPRPKRAVTLLAKTIHRCFLPETFLTMALLLVVVVVTINIRRRHCHRLQSIKPRRRLSCELPVPIRRDLRRLHDHFPL